MKYAHNAELNVIRTVLDAAEFEGSLFRGLLGKHFTDPQAGAVWDSIGQHWSDYGKIPAHDTIFENYPGLTKDLLKTTPQEPSDYYAKSILEAYTKRGFTEDLIKILPKIEDDVKGTLEGIRQLVSEYDIIREGIQVRDLYNTARERFDEYNRVDIQGIKFGWDTLDEATMGAQKGQLIGYAARGGQGKTWCLLYNALTAWKSGYNVLMVASEVPPLDMLRRADALYLGCNYNLFKKQLLASETYSQYEEFLFNSEAEAQKRFKIVDGFNLTPSGINVLVDHHKFDAVFIDGVYLIESDGHYTPGQDWQKVRLLANELKHKVARAKNIPVIFNTQFGRNVGTAIGKTKKVEGGVEDMAYGDEFGKAADLLVSIFRDEEDVNNRRLSMKVIKGREIADGLAWKVDFDFSRLSFREYVEAEQVFGQDMSFGPGDWAKKGF